jgi:hypothetical protein
MVMREGKQKTMKIPRTIAIWSNRDLMSDLLPEEKQAFNLLRFDTSATDL